MAEAAAAILTSCGAADWIAVEIEPKRAETFRRARRGRPTHDTPYVRSVTTRFELTWHIDHVRMAEDAKSDGVFPLVQSASKKWRALNGSRLLSDVIEGVSFIDGLRADRHAA